MSLPHHHQLDGGVVNTRDAFVPPNPKEFDRTAVGPGGSGCAASGTKFPEAHRALGEAASSGHASGIRRVNDAQGAGMQRVMGSNIQTKTCRTHTYEVWLWIL